MNAVEIEEAVSNLASEPFDRLPMASIAEGVSAVLDRARLFL